jgi:hypothetical protein
MEVLFVFLKWVGTFSYRDEETGSRMDLANLATVICPSILYAKGANAARDESFIAISVVQDLLENQDEYYFVPAELEFVIHENIFSIFAKELDLPPKEIHRHCSKYMQARGGVAGMGRPMGPKGLPTLDYRLTARRATSPLKLTTRATPVEDIAVAAAAVLVGTVISAVVRMVYTSPHRPHSGRIP